MFKIMKTYKKVFICSPYKDNPEENYKKALEHCKFVAKQGFLPIAPHVYFTRFLNEEDEREIGIEMGLQLLSECDELWVFGSRITEGMQKEIQFAKERGIPVKFIYTQHSELQDSTDVYHTMG